MIAPRGEGGGGVPGQRVMGGSEGGGGQGRDASRQCSMTSTLRHMLQIRNDNGNNTDNGMNVLAIFMSTFPYLIMALASVSRYGER